MFPFCKVSPGFCLLALWFGYINGWCLLGTVLGAAALHEVGHWLVLRLAGGKATALRIGVLGAVMETDSSRLSYPRELAVVLAGPAVNLAAAFLLSRWGAATAAGAHLALAAVNLLPLWPLDGGRALTLLLCWWLGPGAGNRAVGWIGGAAAMLLALALLYVVWATGGSLWLLPACFGAGVAGVQNFSGKMQEMK